MRRWQIKFDGASAGHVYADTLEAARRAAAAAYARVHAEREDAPGRVNVDPDGVWVESEIGEAKQLVSEVYEGLRLLPGMEMPAEKLRSAVLLLETAALRPGSGADVSAAAATGGGGDTELREALEPLLASRAISTPVKARLRGLVEWVGLNTPEAERRKVELQLFGALWEGGLIDPRFAEPPGCELHRASAFLTRRLTAAGALRVERFAEVTDPERLRAALAPFGKDAVSTQWAFAPQGEPAPLEPLRPLVLLGERVLQPALFRRAVPTPDDEVVAFDRTLFDLLARLQHWTDGLGRQAEPHLKEKQLQLLARTEKRARDVRQQMAKAAKEGGEVLPPETARRDLIKFLIDQMHRIADALVFLPDRSLRDAFGELVFKDVVYRGAGAYLSKRFGIDLDTEVVEGAESQPLTGRYKNETDGPRPKRPTTRIHSVVVPCYTRDGAAIRPASVRVGDY